MGLLPLSRNSSHYFFNFLHEQIAIHRFGRVAIKKSFQYLPLQFITDPNIVREAFIKLSFLDNGYSRIFRIKSTKLIDCRAAPDWQGRSASLPTYGWSESG